MCRDPAHNSHCSQNFLPRSTSCPQTEPLQQQSLWKHRMGSSFPTNWLLGLTQVDLLSQIRNLVSNNLAGKMYEQSSLPDFKNLNGSKSTWELKSKRYGLKLLRPRSQNFETPKLAFYFCICLLSSVVLWVAFSWQIPPAHCSGQEPVHCSAHHNTVTFSATLCCYMSNTEKFMVVAGHG